MIPLARHIELLLLEHDCVIVPGLGGFIANYADALYSREDEHIFLPPYRTIGFNPQLQMNDGLLVQSYMAAYDTSYPFANLQLEQDLENMLTELNMRGEYELENLGVLKKGLNQNIVFTAQDSTTLTPPLYGLYSYEMLPLQRLLKEREIEHNMQAASSMGITNTDNELGIESKGTHCDMVIRINRHWLDFGISVAAAVVLFFCFSYPALKNISTDTDTVVAAFPSMGETDIHSQTFKANKSVNEDAETTSLANTNPMTPTKESVPSVAKQHEASNETEIVLTAPKYVIVLASYVSRTNAEMFIKSLAKSGLTEGRYVKEGKVSRILYSEYQTEAEAQTALRSLRQQSNDFAKAWILAL